MEKSNEESSGGRQEKAIHAHPGESGTNESSRTNKQRSLIFKDADDEDDDETDAQNEKYEPTLSINSSRFVRNHPLMGEKHFLSLNKYISEY